MSNNSGHYVYSDTENHFITTDFFGDSVLSIFKVHMRVEVAVLSDAISLGFEAYTGRKIGTMNMAGKSCSLYA